MTQTTRSSFSADGRPALIGSLPLRDHVEALAWILAATPAIPLWPQLPVHPTERMLPQCAEGIPCITLRGEEDPRFDIGRPGFEEEMLAFYEDYLAWGEGRVTELPVRFQLSRQRAAGLHLLAERLPDLAGLAAVKGQITGPFTMLTAIKDSEGRAGYYDETIHDMVVKALALKAAWQAGLLRSRTTAPVLLFVDEPALAGLGSSAFLGVDPERITSDLAEMTGAIHQAGALAGIHVCANTDWPLLLRSDIDILSFDAFGFFDRLLADRDELENFLGRGGILAWGIVPTETADLAGQDITSLLALWESQAARLTRPGRDQATLLRQVLITPSCGTGSLSPTEARRVLELTQAISATLRQRYPQAG
ncbi:MAG: hypothetical protein BWK76_15780 [Desulfobulbaceae bacterium A2]|nr:MAG: hypothetical protein BWK76_15780 [Desulfobulbaceae bacterium A2]